MSKWFLRHAWRLALVAGLTAMLGLAVACGDDDDDGDDTSATPTQGGGATTPAGGDGEALKIGALLSFTGDLGSFGEPIYNGIELAVTEINAGGGVNGQPVELVRADDATSPQQGVSEAQRLVDVEGINAMVGTLASGVSVQVAETVTGPAKIPQISPASTSPSLTIANDDDFLFRTTISDAAQGIVLSNLAVEEGIDAGTGVCDMYVNSPYGQGLSTAFKEHFEAAGGTVTAEVPHEQGQTTYAAELGQCGDADTLAAMAYPQSATTFLREAVEGNLFENYLFVDGTKDPAMFTQLGYASFDGMVGTSPSSLPTESADSFFERYEAAYGEAPPKPYIKEAYDATYLIALAAEKAGSNDGTAIRDALRDVSNDPGTPISPGPDGWADAIAAIENGEDINYEGTGELEWDDAGDPLVGAIEWWHVDAAAETLVTDKKFRVDLTTEEVTEFE
jgi:ABC-type branched-subunit amino acid transport system substrate-binding protein